MYSRPAPVFLLNQYYGCNTRSDEWLLLICDLTHSFFHRGKMIVVTKSGMTECSTNNDYKYVSYTKVVTLIYLCIVQYSEQKKFPER